MIDELRDALRPKLAEHDARLLVAALRRHADTDDPAERAALRTVLGHAAGYFDLRPHADVISRLTGCALPTGTGDDPPWRPAEVLTHDRPCAGIAVVTVRPWRRLHWRPGQAVPVSLPRHPGRWRWYSPANVPRPDGTVELHVRAVPAGTVSGSLVHEVRPGDLLHLGPPADTGLHLTGPDLLLVAGGTGLAPLRALVEQAAAEAGDRRVILVVGARTFPELYDAISLDTLQCAHGWLTVVPALSHDPHAAPGEWGDALTVALDHLRPDQDVLLCGPPAMLAGSRLRLLAAGVPADRIHLPHLPEG
ncbi:FAD-binding oxidoreductase [Micromonospora halophytica]|uniref:NAD(P)H-flavin reductase n=1 Tax=Micromonospora halophytica TaxID=47864 RepID=A0A1C5HD63_9ACTN|nr:FAD-binding oxidoreductase [Micromonospora halophytica]SCG43461.1 NAD(P)H-flavin reductase [Micromonospora halophytica]